MGINRKLILKQVTAAFSSFVLAVQPMLVQPVSAQGISTTPISGNTNVYDSANGVPIVDIESANSQGVSHNIYEEFNVGTEGVIFNNVTENFGQSELGGVISGNANLENGAASVILNEVIYNNPSELLGYMEVAGSQADVIIANPYGITCDGCGFINTDHATLTTGTPFTEDGEFKGFDITRGAVAIGELGVDATGVSQFDILSRTVQIDGAIHGQQVNIVAGQNNIIYATGAVSTNDGDGSDAPSVSIDSTVLGGMYADSIKIISTEKGSGVKAPPKMAANAGEMVITADGQLVLGEAVASGNVTAKAETVTVTTYVKSQERIEIEAARDAIVAANAALVADSGLLITAGGNFELGESSSVIANDGELVANVSESIDAGADVSISAANGAVALSVGSDINLGADTDVLATENVDINATNLNTDGGNIIAAGVETAEGTVEAADVVITLSGDANLADTQVVASQDINVAANAVTIGSDSIDPSRFVASRDVGIDVQTLTAEGATVQATNDLDITATTINGGSSDGTGLNALASNAIHIEGQGESITINGGLFQSVDIAVDGTSITNSADMIAYGDTLTLTATNGDVDNSGALETAGTLSIGGSNVNNTDDLTANIVDVVSTDSFTQSGNVNANVVSLDLGGDFTNSGDVTANIFGQITSDVTDIANNEIGGDVTNEVGGSLTINNYLLANIGGDLTNDGDLLSAGSDESSSLGVIVLSVAGTANNAGMIDGANSVWLTANAINNQAGATIEAGTLTLESNSVIDNAGDIIATDELDVTASTNLTNSGQIQGAKVASIEADNLANTGRINATTGIAQVTATTGFDNDGGTIFGEEGVSLYTSAGLDNSNWGSLSSLGYLNIAGIDADGNLGEIAYFNTVDGDEFGAIGDVSIASASFNNGGAIYAVDGNLNLSTSGDLDNTGVLYSGGDWMSLKVAGTIDNNGGAILANNNMLIAGQDFDGENEDQATALINQQKGLIETFNGDIYLYAEEIENSGVAPTVSDAYFVDDYDTVINSETIIDPISLDGLGCFGCLGGPAQLLIAGLEYSVLVRTDLIEEGESNSIISAGNLSITGSDFINDYSLTSASGNISFDLDSISNVGASYGDQVYNYETYYYHEWDRCGLTGYQCWNGNEPVESIIYADPDAQNDASETRGIWGTIESVTVDETGLEIASGTIEAGGSITGYVGELTNGVSENVSFSSSGETAPTLAQTNIPGVLVASFGQVGSYTRLTGDLDPSEDPALSAVNNANLYTIDPDAPNGYLVETRYEFIDQSAFASSDYFLDQIGFDADANQTRLGDAMVETTYIRDQIFDMTGARILQPGLSEKEQIDAMYQNAIDQAENLELRPGVALTPSQQAALTSDIVWLETTYIGGQEVLVPRVYLADGGAQYASLGSAQVTAGGGIDLDVGTFTNNGGTVQAGEQLIINASEDIINNGGDLIGGADLRDDLGQLLIPSVVLTAGGDISNLSGNISGESILLDATNIIIETQKTRFGDDDNGADVANNTAGINATGDLSMIAVNDITMTGTDIIAGGNGYIEAGGDITFAALELETDVHKEFKGGYSNLDATTNQVTTLDIGGSLSIVSTGIAGGEDGDNIIFEGTDITADGHIGIAAYNGSITFAAVQDTYERDSAYSADGLLSSSSGRDQVFDLNNKTASLTGSSISVYGAGDVTAYGTDFNTIGADGEVLNNEDAALAGSLNVTSGYGDVLLYEVENIHAESHEQESSTLGGLFSYESQTSSLSSQYDGVDVAALSDVNLTSSNGDILIQGGTIDTGGDFNPVAEGSVYFQGTIDTEYSASHVNSNNGFTITDTTTNNQSQTASMPKITVAGTNGAATLDNAVIGGRDPVFDEDGNFTGEFMAGATHAGGASGAATISQFFSSDEESSEDSSGSSDDPYADSTTTQVASIASSGTGYEYLDALAANENTIIGTSVDLTNIDYYEQQRSMGVLTQAALMLATQGMGTWQTFLVNQLAQGVISGEFDPEEFVKAAAMTFVTAGMGEFAATDAAGNVTGFQGVGGYLKDMVPAGTLSGTGVFGNSYLSEQWFVDAAIDGVVSSGASSAIYGTDFADGFLDAMTSAALNELTALGINSSANTFGHDQFTVQNFIAKATLNCLNSSLQDGSCASGAIGTLATEVYLANTDTSFMTASEIADGVERTAIIFGALASGGDMNNLNLTVNSSSIDVENNYMESFVGYDTPYDKYLAEQCSGVDGNACRDAYKTSLGQSARMIAEAVIGEVPLIGDLADLAQCMGSGSLTSFECGAFAIAVVPGIGASKIIIKNTETGETVVRNVDNATNSVPDASSFFEGTTYSAKVEAQMASGDFHGFPSSIDNLSGSGTVTEIVGGDGITRFKLEFPGEINGRSGVFEYIREPNGTINHRLFRPD